MWAPPLFLVCLAGAVCGFFFFFTCASRFSSTASLTTVYSETIIGGIGSAVKSGFRRLFAKRHGRKGDRRS